MLNEVVPAFETLRKAGKTRFLGITAVGDTAALLRVIDAEKFDSAQVSYNMLNPSAGEALPAGYPAQDYGRMFDHTQKAGVGVVGIRVIAGGALSGAGRTPSDRLAAAGADRHRLQLRRRSGARAAIDAAGDGRVRRQPAGGRDTVRDHASGDGHDPGRHGDGGRVRGRSRGCAERTAAAGGAGSDWQRSNAASSAKRVR